MKIAADMEKAEKGYGPLGVTQIPKVCLIEANQRLGENGWR